VRTSFETVSSVPGEGATMDDAVFMWTRVALLESASLATAARVSMRRAGGVVDRKGIEGGVCRKPRSGSIPCLESIFTW